MTTYRNNDVLHLKVVMYVVVDLEVSVASFSKLAVSSSKATSKPN